jgi:hypothetical protein
MKKILELEKAGYKFDRYGFFYYPDKRTQWFFVMKLEKQEIHVIIENKNVKEVLDYYQLQY